jgi:hypothetical protein
VILNLLLVLPLLSPALAAQAKGGAAPEPHPWARFKVGTWVKWKTVTVTKTGGTTMVNESEVLQTLVSLDAQKAVLEFVQKSEGREEKTKLELPIKPDAKALALAAEGPKPSKTGTETLTAAGKTFACTWSEVVTGDKGSGRTVMRTWDSDDMPGRLVKSVSTSDIAPGLSSVMTTEVVAFSLK